MLHGFGSEARIVEHRNEAFSCNQWWLQEGLVPGASGVTEARVGFSRWLYGAPNKGQKETICEKRPTHAPCKEFISSVSVKLHISRMVSKEWGLLSVHMSLGSTRNRKRLSLCVLENPPLSAPWCQKRELGSVWQLSLQYVKYIINLLSAWCSLADCFFVALPMLPCVVSTSCF